MEDQAIYTTFFKVSLLLCVALPLLSFLISALISDRYAWVVSIVGPLFMLLATIAAWIVFFRAWGEEPFIVDLTWMTIGDLRITSGILLNDLSAVMVFVVSTVSFLVHLFSIGYMAGDDGEKRYFGMLGFFTFSMLGIVLADNMVLIFVFWELVGFSSYMLIGHWRERTEAGDAARKAFIMNRIGDAGFLVGLMLIWTIHGSFSIIGIDFIDHPWATAAGICIFLGVVGKSAQFPLLTWLPDAMEGPTPVSALIHAATMVAAGVFLLARVNPIFTTEALLVIVITGMLTALIGALAALLQNDIKKILAYSTISQLGLMVTAVGAAAPDAAILHLFAHAFFKACLFLCAGSVIHSLHQAQHQSHVHFDVQDIRNLGGLRKKLPFTFLASIVSGAALAGVPFFSGFLSKEAIFLALQQWKGESFNGRWIIFFLAFIVSFLTALYMVRFIIKIFLGQETTTRSLSITEPPKIMRAPVALLGAASLWFVISWNPFAPSGWLFLEKHSHSTTLTIFSATWILIAVIVGWYVYNRNLRLKSSLLQHTFYLDRFYDITVIAPTYYIARLTGSVDRKLIDRALHFAAYGQVTVAHLSAWWDSAIIDGSVNGVASLSRLIGSFTRSFQGGKIQLYVFWALFAIIIFLIWSLL